MPSGKHSDIHRLILVIALVSFVLFGALQHGQKRYATGFDDGAMSIIKKLVNGENVNYTHINGFGKTEEFKVELSVQDADWQPHTDLNTVCSVCHKYEPEQLSGKEVQ